ncbi:hypothetical protein [Sulfurovum mangrovi]|uniref:hypothetical protein n=1 Tax=Sulfurovum mangrovi TaxID=2893889 RepID=UPI001E458656|nr:hypothetical protein [Sulfurovum mangrovi]UFH60246.1 hypothetical protein LN246_05205 [Sulfurovum mangrovi]
MIENIITNILTFDMNTIGLILGFIGAVLVTIFGLPSIPLLNKGMYVEIKVTKEMKIYSAISRIGLVFIAVGFVFQLLGVVPANQ